MCMHSLLLVSIRLSMSLSDALRYCPADLGPRSPEQLLGACGASPASTLAASKPLVAWERYLDVHQAVTVIQVGAQGGWLAQTGQHRRRLTARAFGGVMEGVTFSRPPTARACWRCVMLALIHHAPHRVLALTLATC